MFKILERNQDNFSKAKKQRVRRRVESSPYIKQERYIEDDSTEEYLDMCDVKELKYAGRSDTEGAKKQRVRRRVESSPYIKQERYLEDDSTDKIYSKIKITEVKSENECYVIFRVTNGDYPFDLKVHKKAKRCVFIKESLKVDKIKLVELLKKFGYKRANDLIGEEIEGVIIHWHGSYFLTKLEISEDKILNEKTILTIKNVKCSKKAKLMLLELSILIEEVDFRIFIVTYVESEKFKSDRFLCSKSVAKMFKAKKPSNLLGKKFFLSEIIREGSVKLIKYKKELMEGVVGRYSLETFSIRSRRRKV